MSGEGKDLNPDRISRHGHLVARLSHLVNWFEFGVRMGVPYHVLRTIEFQYVAHGLDRCKIELIEYLLQNDPELSDGKVIRALRSTPGGEEAAREMLALDEYTPYVEKPSVQVITLEKQSDLVSSLDKIRGKFSYLVVEIRKSLEKSSTPHRDIMQFAFEFFNIRVKKEPKTMIEFFGRLKHLYCFIKYDVLQRLVEEFVKASMQAQMEEYSTTLDEWLKSTTVREFQVAIEEMESTKEKQENHLCPQIPIVITLQGQWMDVLVDCLRKLLDHIFQYKSSLLSRIVVKKGSVVVKLMGLQSDMLPLLSIASKVASQMPYLGILSIRVGRIIITSSLSQSRSPVSNFSKTLHLAIEMNNLFVVESLLDIGVVSPDALNEFSRTALGRASQLGLYDIADTLLKRGADIHMGSGKDHTTALQLAAENGHLNVVKLLMKVGSDPNYQNKAGLTALMLACFHRRMKTIEYLLSKNVNLNSQDENGISALIAVCQQNVPSIVQYLLKAGANPDVRRNDGRSALFIACCEGYIELARLLIKYKADLNLPTHKTITPLMAACQNGHRDIVQLLIKKRVNLDAQTEDGFTALIMAYYQGQMKIVSMLLEAKANVNATANGQTVLFEATLNDDVEMVNLFLLAKANPNLTTDDGIGPLHLACSGNVEITDLLLRAGALADKVGGSQSVAPLHIACQSGEYQIVELLLKYKANVNVVDDKGLTPLCIAAATGNTGIINLLLAADASIELQQNQAGWTPLFFAVAQGHLEVVNLLIEHGASMNPNERNKTPLDIAILAGHQMIVEALQAAAQGSKPTQASSSTEEKRIMKRKQPLSEEIKALPYFSILMEGLLFYKNFRESYAKSSITDLPLPKEHIMFEKFGIQTSPAFT